MKKKQINITAKQILITTILLFSLIGLVHSEVLNDKGMISETTIQQVIHVKNRQEIIDAINLAKKSHLKISIAAMQHSQGGQTLARNGIVLDMLHYDHVLSFNPKEMQITIEPGITWRSLQKVINPYHLAIEVMQSSNIFTVGGSMSVNAHGLDFRLSPFINSVVSFHLILANGDIIEVSRNENAELWRAVIGGYGLLGVISDVTLQLVPDTRLQSNIQLINVEDLNKIFIHDILPNKNNVLFLGRLSIAPGKDLLKKLLLITFSNTGIIPKNVEKLTNPESTDFIVTPLFNWSRDSSLGKSTLWQLEKIAFHKKYDKTYVTRNNAMNFAIDFAVSHHQKNHADWLQEYYLPPENLTTFMNYLRKMVVINHINLLNATIRYVQEDAQSILSYANRPMFSVVIYFDQELDDVKINNAKLWTRNLIEKAQSLGGNYYLPYQLFATREQFQKGYPQYEEFIRIKKQYDASNLFSNNFYVEYLE